MHNISLGFYGILLLIFSQHVVSATLNAAYEQAPPNIFVNKKTKTLSGPGREIIEEAVGKLGYKINWSSKKNKPLDLVTKSTQTVRDNDDFLPPMVYGFEDSTVYFIVKKGKANKITDYADLRPLSILVKKRHNYFSKFDRDKSIKKISAKDHESLVKRFVNGDAPVMATKDLLASELLFQKLGFSDWEFADYFFPQVTEHYYSIPKSSAHTNLYTQINCSLYEMRRNGRVSDLYGSYELDPPLQLFSHRNSIAQQEMCEPDTKKQTANR